MTWFGDLSGGYWHWRLETRCLMHLYKKIEHINVKPQIVTGL